MTDRVRVTGPARRSASRAGARDIDADTRLGGVYMRSLLREQLLLAVRVLVLLTLGLGALPLAFHLVPRLAETAVFGVPLAWLLLAVAVYPFLFGLGWYYVRRAERNERHFTELLEGTER